MEGGNVGHLEDQFGHRYSSQTVIRPKRMEEIRSDERLFKKRRVTRQCSYFSTLKFCRGELFRGEDSQKKGKDSEEICQNPNYSPVFITARKPTRRI